jgi:hypothetical protein
VAATKPPAKPPVKPTARGSKGPRLNFKLELSCACKPPICPHAGPGIAKLLQAAYSKGREDGMSSAIEGITKAAAKAGVTVEVGRGSPAVARRGAPKIGPVGVRQKGSRRTQ